MCFGHHIRPGTRQPPSNGVPFSTQPVLQLLDANNNPIPGQTETITGVEQYRRAQLGRVPRGANHGSVIVILDGINYLVDAWMASFKVLPLISGTPSSTGNGIHDVRAVPIESGFEIITYPGFNREQTLPFRPEPEYDPVAHPLFLARYDRTKAVGFFNDAIFVCRHLPDSIITMGRKSKFHLAADGTLTKTEPTEAQRKKSLIEDFGLSEEIIQKLPPDVPGGGAPPGL